MKKNIRNSNVTDTAELNQHFYNGSFTYLDRLSVQAQIEKEQMRVTVTNLNTIHTGVFTYQPNKYDWIFCPELSKSRCSVEKQYLIDKDSWSVYIDEFLWTKMIN